MHKRTKRSQSPYAKYDKSPHRYSENYRHWHELSVKLGVTDTPEHRALNKAFRTLHGLPQQ